MFKVKLTNVVDTPVFAEVAMKAPFRIDVQHGRYCVDGKSLLGLYSLNLSEELTVLCQTDIDSETAFITSLLDRGIRVMNVKREGVIV